jgi:hypothetical protein
MGWITKDNDNINKQEHKSHTLVVFAAFFGHTDTIDYLLNKHLEELKNKPKQFVSAISGIYFKSPKLENH